MAGKIVPAISSSNAMVASFQVTEAIKLLTKNYDKVKAIRYNRYDKERISSFSRKNDTVKPDVS